MEDPVTRPGPRQEEQAKYPRVARTVRSPPSPPKETTRSSECAHVGAGAGHGGVVLPQDDEDLNAAPATYPWPTSVMADRASPRFVRDVQLRKGRRSLDVDQERCSGPGRRGAPGVSEAFRSLNCRRELFLAKACGLQGIEAFAAAATPRLRTRTSSPSENSRENRGRGRPVPKKAGAMGTVRSGNSSAKAVAGACHYGRVTKATTRPSHYGTAQ